MSYTQEQLKQQLAGKAVDFIQDEQVIGVGSGTTIHELIKVLGKIKSRIEACVSSSNETSARLRALGLPVVDMNTVSELPIYFDGADAINLRGEMKKGGGAALTREKILATYAKKFVCLVDETKLKNLWDDEPVVLEVIPCARSAVGREILKLGGSPEYRTGVLTDNGNIIIDVYGLDMLVPIDMERRLNQIVGVVENGVFAARIADEVLIATQMGLQHRSQS